MVATFTGHAHAVRMGCSSLCMWQELCCQHTVTPRRKCAVVTCRGGAQLPCYAHALCSLSCMLLCILCRSSCRRHPRLSCRVQDGAAFDEQSSVHHRVLNAVVETLPGTDCYGVVDVFEDCLKLTGFGRLETADMPSGQHAAAPQHLAGPVPDVQPGQHQQDQKLEQAAIARQLWRP